MLTKNIAGVGELNVLITFHAMIETINKCAKDMNYPDDVRFIILEKTLFQLIESKRKALEYEKNSWNS